MTGPKNDHYRIAIIKWFEDDDLANVFSDELSSLGHLTVCFYPTSFIPDNVDIVFSYGPFGKFMPIVDLLASLPRNIRPLLVHWNTEGIPDIRIPWLIIKAISARRSGIDSILNFTLHRNFSLIPKLKPLVWLNSSMMRFRYVGDYYSAHAKGILNVFSDSSAIYADFHNKHGLPTVFAPWGSTPRWYADLGLKRDIDVLWMGTRGSKRRSKLLDKVRNELSDNGVDMYVADNIENPFIFGDERTEFLNRARITLNITRTWYDDNFSRFSIAAPNRSLIVSENMLSHCPLYKPGIHYVGTTPENLSKAVLFYLENHSARNRIVEEAYRLSTLVVTFNHTIRQIMDAVDKVIANKNQSSSTSSL